jgi:hypothetical protein
VVAGEYVDELGETRSVFGTSPPATSRPVSSTTATARVSLWVSIPAIM